LLASAIHFGARQLRLPRLDLQGHDVAPTLHERTLERARGLRPDDGEPLAPVRRNDAIGITDRPLDARFPEACPLEAAEKRLDLRSVEPNRDADATARERACEKRTELPQPRPLATCSERSGRGPFHVEG
jgi:hypothetical protein